MKKPTIAVIVPVYNAEATLRRCADSVLNQTDKELRLVLVDDGSTDASSAICDEYAAKDDRVITVHKENEGLMATWMRGVRETDAPFLSFLDADDWIDPEMVEVMRRFLTPDQTGQIVCCSYRIEREWNHTSECKGHAAVPGVYEGERLQKEIKDRILGNEERTVILSRCMKLISRELMEDNLIFCDPAIRMGEDVSIMVPAILDAKRLVILQDAYFYHYTFVASSMVHRYDSGMYDNIVRLCSVLERTLKAKRAANADTMLEREFFFLFLLEMKNELRRFSGKAGGVSEKEVISRIRAVCEKENARHLAGCCPEGVQNAANRLIVWMMRSPSPLRIRVVRTIFLAQAKESRI